MVRAALTAWSSGSVPVACRTGQPGRVSEASAARNRAVVSAAGDHVNEIIEIITSNTKYSKNPCSKPVDRVPRAMRRTVPAPELRLGARAAAVVLS